MSESSAINVTQIDGEENVVITVVIPKKFYEGARWLIPNDSYPGYADIVTIRATRR